MRTRRIGRFRVDRRFFIELHEGEGANLFAGMVVLDVQRDWSNDQAQYVAIHPDFREVEDGGQFPEYRPVFESGTTVPRWEEVK